MIVQQVTCDDRVVMAVIENYIYDRDIWSYRDDEVDDYINTQVQQVTCDDRVVTTLLELRAEAEDKQSCMVGADPLVWGWTKRDYHKMKSLRGLSLRH
ncbi:hypothetical protein ACLOJK_038007 [Asimina triloba]